MKTLAYIICYLIYPFSFLVPRSKKQLAFGSYRGSFSDNSKYLYLYALTHLKDKKVSWLSVNRKTVQRLRALGLPAYWVLSPIGAWKAMRAKYWFVSAYTSDIMYCLSGNATVVNLWHGVGLKYCEFNITTGPLVDRYVRKTFKERFYHPESFRRPEYVLTSTECQTRMMNTAFRVPVERCLELGYPRNEILTQPKEDVLDFVRKYEPQETLQLIERCSEFDKVYIYMPTWRDSQKNVFAQQMDLQQLSAELKKQNALLLLKPHPNTIVDNIYQADNIILVERTVDIYGVLPFTDVLITDYSSILYDYILMPKKQVILYLYDYDEYVHERDFYYPFDENVVGRKVETFDDLLKVISTQGYKMDEQDRQRILDRFWGETMKMDSSKEILDYICEA
jgi:CDP-glycerol glycerophosphotransferase (TagB/SpsB family)